MTASSCCWLPPPKKEGVDVDGVGGRSLYIHSPQTYIHTFDGGAGAASGCAALISPST